MTQDRMTVRGEERAAQRDRGWGRRSEGTRARAAGGSGGRTDAGERGARRRRSSRGKHVRNIKDA